MWWFEYDGDMTLDGEAGLFIYVAIMNRRITEQADESMSLNDNTVLIQDYNNLDSSDQYQSGSSSNDHSLSRHHQAELSRDEQRRRASRVDYFDSFLNQHRTQGRLSVSNRPKDMESKYELGISPSTKEEYSLLNPQPRLSGSSRDHQIHSRHRYPQLQMPSLDEEESDHSDLQSMDDRQEQMHRVQPQRRKSSGNNHMKRPNDKEFDINSFLNAHPVPVKNKKGLSVLGNYQSNPNPNRQTNIKPKAGPYQKLKLPIRPQIKQQSIVLVTLPEQDSIYSQINRDSTNRQKAILKSEQQQQQIRDTLSFRLRECQLNFINTFTPDPLKPKSSPYNFLKYVRGKHPL